MFVLFVVMCVALVAIVWTQWDDFPWSSLSNMRIACVVGVSAVALVALNYLPIVAAQADREEANKDDPAKVTTPAEAESSDKPTAKPSEKASPDEQLVKARAKESSENQPPKTAEAQSSDKQLAKPVEAELPDKQLAKTENREPVKFITNVKYLTANRPSWVESTPMYEGELYKVAIKAGPYRTVRDCEPDLRREVKLAVADFVNQQIKAPHASTFISYSLDELRRRNVVREQFSEQLETSLGLMNQVHARLVFDGAFRNEVDTRWSEIRSKSRLAQTGLGAGVIFLLLGTLFSYFRVDTATKGYYTGRLQFVTAGTILALVAASVLLAKWIPWM